MHLLLNTSKLHIVIDRMVKHLYYLNTDLETPAFNRDPAFIGDPASIRTLALSPLRLLMSFVPISPVYVNFTLHVLILSVYIYLVIAQGISLSALSFGSSYAAL